MARPDDVYDLVILGAGSTAFAAALRAAELGRRSLMIENRVVGGTCANRGCLPSKNLMEAARHLYDARHPRYAAIEPCAPALDFQALIQQKDALVREYRARKYDSVAAGDAQVEIARGTVRFTDTRTVAIDSVNGPRLVRGERFLIATGSRPRIPAIAGLDAVPYLTSDLLSSDEKMELTALPESLIVVGGGYIALELGQMFARFGTAVTLIERGPHVLARDFEPEVGRMIETLFAAEGITVLRNAAVERVWRDGERGIAVSVAERGGTRELRAEHLLVAAGRVPATEGIGLQSAGVTLDATGAVQVDTTLRTSAPHIWAAGDVIGDQVESQMATPVGAHDGAIAAWNALGDGPAVEVNHRVIPRAIFTDPQIAMVGMTDRQANAAGRTCWCNTLPLELVPRAAAIHETRGLVKMVADAETNEVLGVTMVGREAAEIIHEAAMALRFHATIDDFRDMLHVYPTMAEALKIAAISRYKDPSRLSCCAE